MKKQHSSVLDFLLMSVANSKVTVFIHLSLQVTNLRVESAL